MLAFSQGCCRRVRVRELLDVLSLFYFAVISFLQIFRFDHFLAIIFEGKCVISFHKLNKKIGHSVAVKS